MDINGESYKETCLRLGIKPAERFLLVAIAEQALRLYRSGRVEALYEVSTSLRPPSNVQDSLGTPRGLHEIAERIGGDQPVGMVFKARRPTGYHYSEQLDDGNLITSRILWLRGLEPGLNSGEDVRGHCVDTYRRYVYIHGTNREDKVGAPWSAGCILLRNADMVSLHDAVRAGDHVWIG